MVIKTKKIWIVFVIIALVLTMSSCSDEKNNSSNNTAVELCDTQMDSLLKQVSKSELSGYFGEEENDCNITVEPFAVAEIYGIDKDGDQCKAYAYLRLSNMVAHNDKAYEISGGAGDVIIKFSFKNEDVSLTGVDWSDDGELKSEWLKENYPEECQNKANAYGENSNKLDGALKEKVEKALGVPLETEEYLEIDTDKGTYEIWKSKNDQGAVFDTETIETGKLNDL